MCTDCWQKVFHHPTCYSVSKWNTLIIIKLFAATWVFEMLMMVQLLTYLLLPIYHEPSCADNRNLCILHMKFTQICVFPNWCFFPEDKKYQLNIVSNLFPSEVHQIWHTDAETTGEPEVNIIPGWQADRHVAPVGNTQKEWNWAVTIVRTWWEVR